MKWKLDFSNKISLFQLSEFSDPKKIHNKKYPFYTKSSQYMIKHFKDYANWLKKIYLNSNSKLIEIGSNDGTLLKNFSKTNIDYVGFEPSTSVAKQAIKSNIKTVNSFFNSENIQDLKLFKKNYGCYLCCKCNCPYSRFKGFNIVCRSSFI